RSEAMPKSGATALALAGSEERAPATRTARPSRCAANAWTLPMNPPPPPTRPMRSGRLSGKLIGMRPFSKLVPCRRSCCAPAMKVAIDSYCYHRYFGEIYPGLQQRPDQVMTVWDFLKRAKRLGVAGVSLESCFLPSDSEFLKRLRATLDSYGFER